MQAPSAAAYVRGPGAPHFTTDRPAAQTRNASQVRAVTAQERPQAGCVRRLLQACVRVFPAEKPRLETISCMQVRHRIRRNRHLQGFAPIASRSPSAVAVAHRHRFGLRPIEPRCTSEDADLAIERRARTGNDRGGSQVRAARGLASRRPD